MSLHSFEPDIAARVGVNAAVLYQNILFWTRKNLANARHVKDGKVWTYNSVKAWADMFPYMTGNQIRTALAKLVDAGLIHEGNHNETAYDRTKWYGVPTQIHLGKITNGFGQDRKPIPDTKPDTKPDLPPYPPRGAGKTSRFDSPRQGKADKQKAVMDQAMAIVRAKREAEDAKHR